MLTKLIGFTPNLAAKLAYRNVYLFNKEIVNERGPLVVLAEQHDVALIAKKIGREFKHTLSLQQKSDGGGVEDVCGSFGPLQPTLNSEEIETALTQALEIGDAVLVVCSNLHSITSLVEKLLSLEIKHSKRLGINLLVASMSRSNPIVTRRDLWVRFSLLSNWPKWLDQYTSSPDSISLAAAHHIRELLLKKPADQLLLNDQLVVEQLRSLYTLDLDRPTSKSKPNTTSAIDHKLSRLATLAYLSPAKWADIKDKTRRIFHFFKMVGVSERSLSATLNTDTVFKSVAQEVLISFLLLPVALWGVVNHYIIFKMPQWISFWTGLTIQKPHIYRMVFLPIFYFLQLRLIGDMFSWTFAFIYLLTLPFCGFVAISTVENRSQIWDNLSLIYLLKQPGELRAKLLNLRWEILETVSQIYLPEQSKEYVENIQHQNFS
jgi:hypothetical protein